MDKLPKILPIWTNAAEQHLTDLSRRLTDDTQYHPDFGGAGVDLSINEDGVVSCVPLKCHDTKTNKLCATNITLPFSAPNKVDSPFEPCLQQQLDLNNRIKMYESLVLCHRRFVKAGGPLSDCVHKMLECSKSTEKRKSFKDADIACPLVRLKQARPESMEHRECNWSYTGGCLSAIPIATEDGRTLICHPCGPCLSSLAVAELRPGTNTEGPLIQKVGGIVLKQPETTKSAIFQVSTEAVEDEIYCCLRFEDHSQYLRLFDSVQKDPVILADFSYDDTVCFAVPSCYVPGELLSVTRTGKVLLQSCESTLPNWQMSASHERDFNDQWWCCGFGGHPRQVVYMDHTALYDIDARISTSRRRILCNTQNDVFINDQFTLFKRNPLNCHQVYLASSRLLSVWDERHAKQPMLTWNHGLGHSPTFLEMSTLSGATYNLCLILGSQRSKEVAVFSVQQDSSLLQPTSSHPPWHLSMPCDFVKHLEHQGCQVEPVVESRVTAPLVGACIVDRQNGGFTTLQLTSFGDLFYQDFAVSTARENFLGEKLKFDMGSDLIPASKINDAVKWWKDLVATLTPCEDGQDERIAVENIRDIKECLGLAWDDAEFAVPTATVQDDECQGMQFQLEHLLLNARDERRTLNFSEWASIVPSPIMDDESGDVDDLMGSISSIDINSWDANGKRYLEKWMNLPQVQPSTEVRQGTEERNVDVIEDIQDPMSWELQELVTSAEPIEIRDDLCTGFTQETTSFKVCDDLPCPSALPDPSDNLPDPSDNLPDPLDNLPDPSDNLQTDWFPENEDNLLFLSQTSVATEGSARESRSNRQPVKRRRPVFDGF